MKTKSKDKTKPKTKKSHHAKKENLSAKALLGIRVSDYTEGRYSVDGFSVGKDGFKAGHDRRAAVKRAAEVYARMAKIKDGWRH